MMQGLGGWGSSSGGGGVVVVGGTVDGLKKNNTDAATRTKTARGRGGRPEQIRESSGATLWRQTEK